MVIETAKEFTRRASNSSLVRKAKTLGFYTMNAAGGLAVASQIRKIPYIQDSIDGLKDYVNGPIVDTLEDVVLGASSALLLGAAGHYSKKARKKRDFSDLRLKGKSPYNNKSGSSRFSKHLRNATLATGAGLLALASHESAPEIASQANDIVNNGIDYISERAGNVYEYLFNSDSAISTASKLVGGLSLTALANNLYGRWCSKKHGPILKRYFVNGRIPSLRWMAPNNIRLKLQNRFFESPVTRQIEDGELETSKVDIHDFVSDSTLLGIGGIYFNPEREPKLVKSELTKNDIDFIKELLDGKAKSVNPEAKLYGRDVFKFAQDIKLYDAIKVEYENSDKSEEESRPIPSRSDVQSVLEVLASKDHKDTLVSDIASSSIYSEREKTLSYEEDCGFARTFWIKDSGGILVKMSRLMEHTGLTRQNTKKGAKYSFFDNDKVYIALGYRTFRGVHASDVTMGIDIDFSMDEEIEYEDQYEIEKVPTSETTGNTIEHQRKPLIPPGLEHGKGDLYTMQFHGNQYTIEEEYLGSFPIPFTNYRLRRKHYVRDSDGHIVGKISETWNPLKLIGDNNRRIDIYDPQLARSDAPGFLLSNFSEFLINKGKYTSNRGSVLARKPVGVFGS